MKSEWFNLKNKKQITGPPEPGKRGTQTPSFFN